MKSKFFIGQTGSGKTLSVMKEAARDVFLGRTLFSNMQQIKILPYYYVDLEDLIEMVSNEELDINDNRPKTLVLDEIHTMFDGRRASSRKNIDFSNFVSQCRKRRFNVYYTSQWISGADPRLRTLTNELTICIPHINYNDVGLGDMSTPEPISIEHRTISIADNFVSGLLYGNMNAVKSRRKVYPRWRNRPFYKYYDTYEIIRPVESYSA